VTRASAREISAQNAVLEASPNAVVAVDSGGLIVYANPQVETTFGYERAELVGQPIEILLPERAAANDVTVRDARRQGLLLVDEFEPVRRYAKRLVNERLHQPMFRSRVLFAYRNQCALCRLRHPPLLDAANIKDDADGGAPIVTNGMAMCAIHHRAFDANVLGIRPDYAVEIRADVLAEHDGPTLQHALQGLHGQLITLPQRRAERPSEVLLDERYERFRAAG